MKTFTAIFVLIFETFFLFFSPLRLMHRINGSEFNSIEKFLLKLAIVLKLKFILVQLESLPYKFLSQSGK